MSSFSLINSKLTSILENNRRRERNFQAENNTNINDVVNKYPAMNGRIDKDNLYATCTASYPGSTFNGEKYSQLNYVNQINSNFKKMENLDLSAQEYHNREIRENFGNTQNYTQNHTQNQDQNQNQNGQINMYNANNDQYRQIASQFNQPIHNMQFDNEQNQHNVLGRRNLGVYNTSNYEPQNIVPEYNQFLDQNNANGYTSMYLQNMNNRPMSDFTHNNMVPFSTKFTQNMAGTGVRSGSDIDGGTFDSGADMSTPYQTKLATFTGIDDTYMHKRETPSMYSPGEQQTGYVYGMPLFRPDMDQYTQSMKKMPDLKPVESVNVGRGLDIDPNMPANGGFHDFTRIMPNNVSDYKANQLEGRVILGRLAEGGQLPTSYPGIGTEYDQRMSSGSGPGIVKNRPPSYYTQARRPTMTTKVAGPYDGNATRPEYQVDMRPNNATREQTSYGFGSLSAGKPSKFSAPVQNSYNSYYNGI